MQLEGLGVPKEKITVFCPNDKVTWLDERYAMAKACIRYIRENKIKGSIAELGVYKGAFSSFLSNQLPDRKIYLFDTFECFADSDLVTKEVNGDETVFKDTSVQKVLDIMPVKEKVVVRKGWFPETAQDIDDTFCFVSLDADLYKPILAGLEFFYPRLEYGGYIFIHDFESVTYPGCKQAVLEFCKKYNVGFVPILDRCASVVITK
ncbi:MAG: TylF/MycF/NovP-related O-methyltransferase [Treponema sp.]